MRRGLRLIWAEKDCSWLTQTWQRWNKNDEVPWNSPQDNYSVSRKLFNTQVWKFHVEMHSNSRWSVSSSKTTSGFCSALESGVQPWEQHPNFSSLSSLALLRKKSYLQSRVRKSTCVSKNKEGFVRVCVKFMKPTHVYCCLCTDHCWKFNWILSWFVHQPLIGFFQKLALLGVWETVLTGNHRIAAGGGSCGWDRKEDT